MNFLKAPDSNTLSTEEQEGRTTIAPAAATYSRSGNNEDYLTIEDTLTVTANENEEMDFSKLFNDQEEIERFNKVLMQRPGSRALSVPAFFPLALINRYTSSNLLLSTTRPQAQAQPRQQQPEPPKTSSSNRVKSNKITNKYNRI